MSLNTEILGYFILPLDGSKGLASLSLSDLIETNFRIPFLNPDKLELLKSSSGVNKKIIDDVILPAGLKEKQRWSPTAEFLHELSGQPSSKFSSDTLIITLNRKIITQILKFGKPNNLSDLPLKTKVKNRSYGKQLQIASFNQRDGTTSNNLSFGSKFEYYITDGDQQVQKNGAKLFSIHCIKIDNVCFIYEADIDAVEYTKDGKVSLIEIKTYRNRTEIEECFKKYTECNEMKDSLNTQIESSLNRLETKFTGTLGLPFYQGELGNVCKFIYGFYDQKLQGDKSFVNAEEFKCYTGTALHRGVEYFRDFVGLLEKSGITSQNENIGKDWDTWKLTTKNESSLKLAEGKLGEVSCANIPLSNGVTSTVFPSWTVVNRKFPVKRKHLTKLSKHAMQKK